MKILLSVFLAISLAGCAAEIPVGPAVVEVGPVIPFGGYRPHRHFRIPYMSPAAKVKWRGQWTPR